MSRPTSHFDEGLPHERTALAWERTAVSTMVVGILIARYAAGEGVLVIAAFGLAHTILGAGVLIWAGRRYDDLHGPLREGADVTHPGAARATGIGTITALAVALGLSLGSTLS